MVKKTKTIVYEKCDYFKPLEECSKEEVNGEASEYDTMIGISRMPAIFTEEELQQEMKKVLFNKTMGSLVEKGLVHAVWDPEVEDFRYYPAT